jgi:hypothetical protein
MVGALILTRLHGQRLGPAITDGPNAIRINRVGDGEIPHDRVRAFLGERLIGVSIAEKRGVAFD